MSNPTRHHLEASCILHQQFARLETALAAGTTTLKAQLLITRTNLATITTTTGKAIPNSIPTLERKLQTWRRHGRTAETLLPDYNKSPAANKIPDLLIQEYQRLATLPTGGRNKHGRTPLSVAYQALKKNWLAGKHIPRLGTWTQYWLTNKNTKQYPLPPTPPEFPFTARALRRHQPNRALTARANIGASAAKNHEAFIERDYSTLRRAELYTLDDARIDIIAINELTGRVEEIGIYLFMEVASRSIVSFVCKPRHSIVQEDVDQLIAHALQAPGYGIGTDYTTHILFERGTVACSTAAQTILEAGSGDRIKVLRTSINQGIRWVGAAPDQNKGNAQGKAVIESFIRRLHHQLLHLPGQRGNNWENAPENLGFGRNHNSYRPFLDQEKEAKRLKLSTTAEAERLAQFNRRASAAGNTTEKLKLPLLTFTQIRKEIADAIKHLNSDRGHHYQGHHKIQQIQTAPGIWQDIQTS